MELLTPDMPIGARVVVATRKNPAALTYTKVGRDRWIEERNRRSRCTTSTDTQVQWWLTYHPEKTTALDPILREVVEL